MKIFNANWLINLEKTILWQYDKATKLNSLIKAKQKWYQQNVSFFITNFFLNVFDIKRANDFGLTIWGKLLNFPRQIILNKYQITAEQTEGTGLTDISVARSTFNSKVGSGDDFTATTIQEDSKYTFIFTYNGADWDLSGSFSASNVDIADYGVSFTGTPQTNDSITIIADYTPLNLTTEQYRFLLLGQVLKFRMSATLPEINRYLRVIFEQANNDNVYVTDNHDMTITYTLIPTVLSNDIKKLIGNYDFLPHPAGVKATTNSGNYVTFTIDTGVLDTAIVKFTVDGQEYFQKSIDVEIGTDIAWEVSDTANGFITQSGTEEDLSVSKTIQVILQTQIRIYAMEPNDGFQTIELTINGTTYYGTDNIVKTVNAGDSYSYTVSYNPPTPVPPAPAYPKYFPETESGIVTKIVDRNVYLQRESIFLSFEGIYGNGVEKKGTYNIVTSGAYKISLGGDKSTFSGQRDNAGGLAELQTTFVAGDKLEIKVIYGGTTEIHDLIGGCGVGVWLNGICIMVAGGAGKNANYLFSCGGGGYNGGLAHHSGSIGTNYHGYSYDGTRGDNQTTNDGAGHLDRDSSSKYSYGGSGYIAEEYANIANLVYEGNTRNYAYASISYIEEEEEE